MHIASVLTRRRPPLRFGLALALVSAVAAVAPGAASASVITPHVQQPSTVTTHVVEAAPSAEAANASDSAPEPTSRSTPAPPTRTVYEPGESASAGDSGRLIPDGMTEHQPGGDVHAGSHGSPSSAADLPGSSIPDGDNDPPFPEGLPAHDSPECTGDCQQEWLDYISSRASIVYQASVAGEPDLKPAAEALLSEKRQIETTIEKAGGEPGSWEADKPQQGDSPVDTQTQTISQGVIGSSLAPVVATVSADSSGSAGPSSGDFSGVFEASTGPGATTSGSPADGFISSLVPGLGSMLSPNGPVVAASATTSGGDPPSERQAIQDFAAAACRNRQSIVQATNSVEDTHGNATGCN